MTAALLRRAARAVLRDYRLNWVLRSPAAPTGAALPDGLTVHAPTAADPAAGYVLVESGEPRCVTHFTGADDYADPAIWPLTPGELALIEIVTRADSRGRGLAPLLIAAATPMALARASATRAICFIWWNHHASLRAFRRAGWRRIGFSIEVTTRNGRVWRRRVGLRFAYRA